jgi:mRNA interferase MazF
MPRYVPNRGDVVWINFDPQAGHEQKGRRLALIDSPREYNAPSGLALCCPITSRIKGYPFEVPVSPANGLRGVILCDHVRNVDWRARKARFITQASADCLDDVLAKIEALLRR